MPCFYTPDLTQNHKTISITGSEHHHITKVFRMNVGKEIFLNSGNGVYALAKIKVVDKKSLSCEILDFIPRERYTPNIALAFSLLRNKNDYLLVEKLTELGVAEFFPFESEYSVRKANDNTSEKFKTTAIEAIKQCDNGFLPTIHETEDLGTQLNNIEKLGYQILVASEKEQFLTLKSLLSGKVENPICILVGPEGGFSQGEFATFTSKKYQQYKLGINILRAETAAICAVSQVINILL